MDEKVIIPGRPKQTEGTPIKCHRCGYPWKTRSKRRYVSCPDCHTLVKNPVGKPIPKKRKEMKK